MGLLGFSLKITGWEHAERCYSKRVSPIIVMNHVSYMVREAAVQSKPPSRDRGRRKLLSDYCGRDEILSCPLTSPYRLRVLHRTLWSRSLCSGRTFLWLATT